MIIHITESINIINKDAYQKFVISNIIYLSTIVKYSGGYKIIMGSSLPSSSFHPIISGDVGRHHGDFSCFPDACLEDTRWGNSPHVPSHL